MTVILRVSLGIALVLIPQQGLELHITGFLCTEGLDLCQGVLPMELAALLLPLVVGLHLFLLAVVISDFANLVDRLLSLFLRILSDLDQLLDFRSDLFVLILYSIFESSYLLLNLILDLALHVIKSIVYSKRLSVFAIAG